jgi:hypothetical protein
MHPRLTATTMYPVTCNSQNRGSGFISTFPALSTLHSGIVLVSRLRRLSSLYDSDMTDIVGRSSACSCEVKHEANSRRDKKAQRTAGTYVHGPAAGAFATR